MMSTAVYPSPKSLRTKSTVKRRPRIVGLPLQTVGSIWILSKAIAFQYAILSHAASPEETSSGKGAPVPFTEIKYSTARRARIRGRTLKGENSELKTQNS